MKTGGTHLMVVRAIIFILLLLYSLLVFGQPEYDFTSGSLISGTDRQVGAVYRYNNVRSGVDARVTIMALTGGLTLSNFDGGSGFAEALQPVINVPAFSTGYVELKVDFLTAGTNNAMVQSEIPVTPIDVDGQNYGSGTVYEFDEVFVPNGYYMYEGLGGELSITIPTPGLVRGTNIAGIDYAGIDTAVKRVMFTAVNGSLSTVTFRVGGINNGSSSQQRLRSVYFRKFNYPNVVLPVSDLKSFSGCINSGKVVLNWELFRENRLTVVELEKSSDGIAFTTVASFLVVDEAPLRYNYNDQETGSQKFYRLKLVSEPNRFSYSNVIIFRSAVNSMTGLTVYPTVVKNAFTARVQALNPEDAVLRILDASGRIALQKSIALYTGENNIQVNGLERLSNGNYFVLLVRKEETLQKQIIKN